MPAVTTMVDAMGNVIAFGSIRSVARRSAKSDRRHRWLAIVRSRTNGRRSINGVDWKGTPDDWPHVRGRRHPRWLTIEQQYVKNYQPLVISQTDAEKRAVLTPSRASSGDPDGADVDKTFWPTRN